MYYILEDYCYQPEHRVLSSIRREIGAQWIHIGYNLGLERSVLKIIEQNVHEVEEQAFQMLNEWLQRDLESCYCRLISAMYKQGLGRGVDVFKKNIKSSNLSMYIDLYYFITMYIANYMYLLSYARTCVTVWL